MSKNVSPSIFLEARKLRATGNYNGKSWQQLVQLAAKNRKKQSTSPKIANTMPAKKKGTTRRRSKSVGAVRTVTRTRTVKAKTKRRSIGAIVDKSMIEMGIGMAATSAIVGAIKPLREKLPPNLQKLVDPAMAVAGYMIGAKAKSPMVRGVGFGIMAVGVQNTTSLIMGMMGQRQPVVIPTAPTTPAPGSNVPSGGKYLTATMAGIGDIYMPLPNMAGIGAMEYAGSGMSVEDMQRMALNPLLHNYGR